MTNEQKAIVALAVLLLAVVGWLVFGGRHDNDAGRVQRIEAELNSIRQDNHDLKSIVQSVSEAVNRSRSEVGESRTTVVTVRERIETDGVTLEEARRINNSSQSILDGIRKRAESNPK